MKAQAVIAILDGLGLHPYPDRSNPDYTIHFDIYDPTTNEPVVQGAVDSTDVDGPWSISLFGGQHPIESISFNDEESLKNLIDVLKIK